MNKDEFIELLSSESELLTLAEIEAIMDEEMAKDPNEMDLDLIDRCLDALELAKAKNQQHKRVKLNISKALAAAIAVVLVFVLTIPACAKYFHANVPNGVVEFYGECFNVDIDNDNSVNDIEAKLRKDGIENPILPRIIYELDTEISNYTFEKSIDYDMTTFFFNNEKFNGKVYIQKYKDDCEMQLKKPLEVDNYDMLEVNGISVLIFGNNKASHIEYTINNVEYSFTLNCSFNTALEIAKTI